MKKVMLILMAGIGLASCKKDTLPPPSGGTPGTGNGYSAIVVNGGNLVHISQGTQSAISTLGGVTYTIANGVLTINPSPSGTVNITVAPGINSITANDGALVYSVTPLNFGNVNLAATNSSLISFNLAATSVKVNVSKASQVTLTGTAADGNITASDNSFFYGCGIEVKNCTATASSGSMISVHAASTLTTNVMLSGNALITYKGNPVIKRNGNGIVMWGCL